MISLMNGVFGSTYTQTNLGDGNRQGRTVSHLFTAMTGSNPSDASVATVIRSGVLDGVEAVKEVNGILIPTMKDSISAGSLITIARNEIYIPQFDQGLVLV
jgi:hypothetical protein